MRNGILMVLLATVGVFPLLAVPAFAVFTNGDFETGDFSGWTKSTFLNYGLQGSAPFTGASISRTPGGADTSQIVGGPGVQPLSQNDPVVGAALKYPRFGSYAARVGSTTANNNANAIKQQTTVASADIDPADNKIHVRFAYAPVLYNGGHAANEQPYFYIGVRNVTRNTMLYENFNFSGQSGVPWQTTGSGVEFTDWQLVDIAPGNANLAPGDTVELEVIAAGCAQGGHYGYVYVDGFGSTVPGLNVSATAPGQVNANSNLTYTFTYRNNGTAAINNVVLKETIPTQTTYVSVSDTTNCSFSSGVVTCNLGTLNPGDSGTVQVTVHVNAGASGNINNGNYSVSGTNSPALLGPLVTSSITSSPLVDAYITKTDGQTTAPSGGTVTYTIVAGNNGPSAITGATVVDTMPAALTNVTWTCVAANGATCTSSGTGNINDTIDLPSNGTATYTVAATVSPSASGNLTNNASITAPAGVTDSTPSNNADADTDTIVDTTPPAKPVVTQPAANAEVNTAPSFSGTAEPGSTITVKEGSTTLCTATVALDGSWSCTASSTPSEGSHTVSITATDAANNTSSAESVTFTVDVTAPAAPSVSSPVSGSTTGDTTPAFSGTTEPGATVKVMDGSTVLCTTVADVNGDWSCTATTPLSEGSHLISVVSTDTAGNTSTSATLSVEIDLTAPGAPTIGSADTTGDTTPAIFGSAEAGSTVKVTVDGTLVCTVTAANDGSWTCTVSPAIAEGDHAVSATATDMAGNTSDAASQTLTIDTTLPDAPTITNSAVTKDTTPALTGSAEAGSTVKVTVDGTLVCTVKAANNGSWTCTVSPAIAEGDHAVSATATDTAGNTSGAASQTLTVDTTAPVAPVISDPSLTNDTTPTIIGTAEAGSKVEVKVDGVTVCTVMASDSGAWSCTPTAELGEGQRTVTATATDSANNTGPAATHDLTVDITGPAAPVVTEPTNGSVTNETKPTFVGTAEPGSTVVVMDGATVVCTTTVDENGNWSCTATSDFSQGSHTVSVTAADDAGNVSPTTSRSFLELAPLAAPTTREFAPRVWAYPVIEGTATANSTLTVVVDPDNDPATDNDVTYTIAVGADGNWSINTGTVTPTSGQMPAGGIAGGKVINVTTMSTDAVGNVSPMIEQTVTVGYQVILPIFFS